MSYRNTLFLFAFLGCFASLANSQTLFDDRVNFTTASADSIPTNKACLGVHWRNPMANEQGVVITEIIPNGAAHLGGIQTGDQIIRLNGTPIHSVQEAAAHIHHCAPGTNITLHILRNGKKKKTYACLGYATAPSNSVLMLHPNSPLSENQPSCDLHFEGDSISVVCPDEKGYLVKIEEPFHWRSQGFELQNSPFLGVTPGLNTGHKGAMVAEVISGSAAERMGVEPGDCIISFNGMHIHHFDQLANVVHNCKPGQEIELRIKRDGKTKKIQGKLGERPVHEKDDFRIFHHYQGMDEEGSYRFTYELDVSEDDLEKQLEFMLNQPNFSTESPENFDGLSVLEILPLQANEAERLGLKNEWMENHHNSTHSLQRISYLLHPTTLQLHISCQANPSIPITLRLLTESGEWLLSEDTTAESGIYERWVNFSDRKPGVYFIQLLQNESSFTKKIVKKE